MHYVGFIEAVEEFRLRIVERAKVKRREMDEEMKNKAKEEIPIGPGGLNPIEVLDRYSLFTNFFIKGILIFIPNSYIYSLPQELRAAFESQNIEELQKVLADMDPEDAKYHMKRCIDSGLWVPNNESALENDS